MITLQGRLVSIKEETKRPDKDKSAGGSKYESMPK